MNIYPHRTAPFTSAVELVDFVTAHLMRPGATRSERRPSLGDIGASALCAYRGHDGNRCAIGACINDADYSEDMEGKSTRSHLVLKAAGIPVQFVEIARKLQELHDDSDFWTWPRTDRHERLRLLRERAAEIDNFYR